MDGTSNSIADAVSSPTAALTLAAAVGGRPPFGAMFGGGAMMPQQQLNIEAFVQMQRHIHNVQMFQQMQQLRCRQAAAVTRELPTIAAVKRAAQQTKQPAAMKSPSSTFSASKSTPSPPVVHHNTPLAQQMAFAAGGTEDGKPTLSYIGLIAMAILGTEEHKMVLSDIYQWILDNYTYFQHRGPGWRNSIRHNLSLNDCFVKAGRSANGKGHFWGIHPANLDDFTRGDYRRRRAQRKVRRHMGLSVGDDDSDSDNDGTTLHPPPTAVGGGAWMAPQYAQIMLAQAQHLAMLQQQQQLANNNNGAAGVTKPVVEKRSYSIANLLAKPDDDVNTKRSLVDGGKSGIDSVAHTLWANMSAHNNNNNHNNHSNNNHNNSTFAVKAPSTPSWPGFPVAASAHGSQPSHSSSSASTTHDGSLDLSPQSSSHTTDGSAQSPHKTTGNDGAAAPLDGRSPDHRDTTEVIDTAKQWESTFAKIMARSLQKNNNHHHTTTATK